MRGGSTVVGGVGVNEFLQAMKQRRLHRERIPSEIVGPVEHHRIEIDRCVTTRTSAAVADHGMQADADVCLNILRRIDARPMPILLQRLASDRRVAPVL